VPPEEPTREVVPLRCLLHHHRAAFGGLACVAAVGLGDSGCGPHRSQTPQAKPSDEQRAVSAELERKTAIVVVIRHVASACRGGQTLWAAACETTCFAVSCTRAAVLDDSCVLIAKEPVERVWGAQGHRPCGCIKRALLQLDWWCSVLLTIPAGGPVTRR